MSSRALEATSLHDVYRSDIGRQVEEIATPALVVDLPALHRNIATMADALRPFGTAIRPHIKVHKCPRLAVMQMEAGAIGMATATAWEAVALARSGIPDVLVANQVVGAAKIGALADAARTTRITVAVDDRRNVDDLAAAARAAATTLDVLIELDVGMARGGVRSSVEAVDLARHIASVDGVRLRGLQGYEGHCMLEPDRTLRIDKAHRAMEELFAAVDALLATGFTVDVVSGGGTGTYDITGAHPRLTELQAGSYVFMDAFHGSLVPGFERSLTVLTTCSVRHGATVVFDAGRKSVGIDFVTPQLVGWEHVAPRFFAEEHALFDFEGEVPFDLGDHARIVPGYAPTTVNLYDVLHIAENDVIVDVWPIIPRGPGRGLAGL